MDRKHLAVLVVLALFFSGCLQSPAKLGCCLKQNATDREGCVLYNDSADTITDLTDRTYNEADGQKCNVTASYCNVSYSDDAQPYLIPVCTESDILSCRQPDCVAMVCGDFKFKPPIAPGLSSDGETVKTDIPADSQEEAAMQFFHAQCRFLAMDGNLKKVMKSSKSSLNVFRVGVGMSFDEYEQYRYLFPMSDKFCTINPPREGQLRVDRYMNYLNPTAMTAYDPVDGITTNCMVDSEGVLPPFNRDESLRASPTNGTLVQSYHAASFSYPKITPDKSSYQFAHWGRLDYDGIEYGFGYHTGAAFFSTYSVYKKIDNEYYKKWLSIAHAATIYGKSGSLVNTTRAPFECDIASTDCYSGICTTTTYNRVVMLTPPDSSGIAQEIVTDCESYTDENFKTRIVCYPTTDVQITGPSTQPSRTFAQVDARLAHVEGDGALRYYNANRTACGIFDEKQLERFVDWEYAGGGWGYGGNWADKTCTNVMDSSFMQYAQLLESVGKITYTTNSYMTWYNYTDGTWHSAFSQSDKGPPAGGVVFFGKTDPQTEYGGKTVIGYALVSNGQADDLLVVKNCGMVEHDDYDYVQVPANPKDWGTLKNTFLGYFKLRYQGMKAISTEDSCGATSCTLYEDAPTKACSYFYDFFFAGLPWVINMEKNVHPSEGSLYSGVILNNEMQQAMTKVNRFSEVLVGSNMGTTCALRGLNGGYIFNPSRESDGTNYYVWNEYYQPVYNLLFSEYIVLFYDKGDQKLGNCALDKTTLMPKIKTFGWCEPCTTSTLAYQYVSTREDGTYMPGGIANMENGGTVDMSATQSQVCKTSYDELRCGNNLISDANDFSLENGDLSGGPQTYPEASVLKERLGNYMKSGVMPILDMSSASNWEENPDGNLDEYDFQRLIGKMGAVIVIVDKIGSSDNASLKAQNISTRTALLRSRCYGCLTAFHVSGPSSNESLRERAHEIFSNNIGNKFTVDMVTYDYPVSDHSGMLPAMGADILAIDPGANLSVNYSQIIAEDIASYSQAVLETDNKPTVLVGLSLDNGDTVFNTKEKQTALFGTLFRSQDMFIKAGLIGIIYGPARQVRIGNIYVGPETGIVDVDANNTGTKNTKFCALQQAMQMMTSAPPIGVFAMKNAANYSECIPCESLEKTQGECTADALMCDNGVRCTPPLGLGYPDIEGNFRCQPETVIDIPEGSEDERCTLCKDLPGTYSCIFSYSNGTITTQEGNMSDLSSDLYLDIIAGIERTDKCCLEDSYGRRYTYMKKTSDTSVNRPLAFSKTGDKEADCGLSTSIEAIKEAQSFCDVQIPVKDYDVTCTLSG